MTLIIKIDDYVDLNNNYSLISIRVKHKVEKWKIDLVLIIFFDLYLGRAWIRSILMELCHFLWMI